VSFVADNPCALFGLLGTNFYYYPIGVANLSGSSLEGLLYSCIASISFSFDIDQKLLSIKFVLVVEDLNAVNARRPPPPPQRRDVVVPQPTIVPPRPRIVKLYVPRPRRMLVESGNFSNVITKLQERIDRSEAMQSNACVVYAANELARVSRQKYPDYVQALVSVFSCGYSVDEILDCLHLMCKCRYQFAAVGSKHDFLTVLCKCAVSDLLLITEE
jgi:hypothetical protein